MTASLMSQFNVRFVNECVDDLGGQCSLCWCSGISSCQGSGELWVSIGSITLIGPSATDQDRTCAAGQRFMLCDILGHHSSSKNTMVPVDACSSGAQRTVARSLFDGFMLRKPRIDTQRVRASVPGPRELERGPQMQAGAVRCRARSCRGPVPQWTGTGISARGPLRWQERLHHRSEG